MIRRPPRSTLFSLHDALPICSNSLKTDVPKPWPTGLSSNKMVRTGAMPDAICREPDRKSTRLNSSHTVISYAVFCLKKKKTENVIYRYIHSDYSLYKSYQTDL